MADAEDPPQAEQPDAPIAPTDPPPTADTANETVFAPRKPTPPPPPAASAPPADEANETVFAPRRPTTGPASSGQASSGPPPPEPPAPPRPASAKVEIGMVLNGLYSVTRLIGRGGMGEVYEGVNINDAEDRVAIKVILPSLAADPNMQAMFFKEARSLRALSHPAVVQYRVVAQDPLLGIFYIVTEYIDGPSLSDVLGRFQPTSADLRGLIRRLAEGLRAAHDLGAVHRDISPDNVLLPAGRLAGAKVIDFGIAKDLDPSHKTIVGDGFAGKLGFVAPEQFGDFGREIGPWTDVYSMGLLILSLIQGRNVDMGVTLVEAVDKRRAGPDLSAVPPDLRSVLQAMLIANPADRLRSMDAVLAALDGVAPPPPPPPREEAKPLAKPGKASAGKPSPTGARPPMAIWIGAGAAALLVAVVLGFVLTRSPKKAPATSVAAAAAPAAAATSPRQAIATGLLSIPCSWLELVSMTDTPTGAAVKMTGVAGSTIDAQAAVSQIVSASGTHVADLDFGEVDQVGQSVCSALDTFRTFRTDTSAGRRRLSTAQSTYTMERNPDGKLGAKAVIDVRVGDPRLDVAMFGIEQSGAIAAIIPDRKTLAAAVAAKSVSALDDDGFRLQILTDNQGWSGILLLTGRGPFDKALMETPAAKRDAAWQAKVRQAGQAGGWQAEMVWYRSVAPAG